MAALDNASTCLPDEKSEEISSENDPIGTYQFDVEANLLRIHVLLPSNLMQTCFSRVRGRSLFVLDYSASMRNDWCQIQSAMRYFTDTSDAATQSKTDFIVYNDKSRVSNVNEILSMRSSGYTSFDAAFTQIESYLRCMQSVSNANEVVNIVFMTDGQDNCTRDLQKRLNKFGSFVKEMPCRVMIHTIGFTKSHDRKFLEQLCNLSDGDGIYRFADKSEGSQTSEASEASGGATGGLRDKFEEMFDFLQMSDSVEVLIEKGVKQSVSITRNDAYACTTCTPNGSNNKNKKDMDQKLDGFEMDFIIDLSGELSDMEHQLKNKVIKNENINIRLDSIANSSNECINCKSVPSDEMFELKRVEWMDIKTESDLERAQMLLSAVKPRKLKNRSQRVKAEMLAYLIQLKLNKYYQLFSDMKRGLIRNDDSSIVAQLNSLRHETTFSKARQQRAMNKRILANMKQFEEIQQQLEQNITFPPDAKIMKELFEKDANVKDLKCLLSNETIFDVMEGSCDNIMVWTLNIERAEHLIDAPTAVAINQYLTGFYTLDAIKDATQFAIDEHGTSQALGGFVKSSKFKYKRGNYEMKHDLENNDDMDDVEDGQDAIGLFRGADGVYPNAYLPLYLNSEHFKRVEILLKPVLGYFFTLDPLGFKPNQYLGLYYILGHMVCMRRNALISQKSSAQYAGQWFEWLVEDFGKLCKHLLPTLKMYLLRQKDGILGNIIKSGNLLTEWIQREDIRFSKALVQNLLVLVGLRHIQAEMNLNFGKDEFEVKFIQELWRRNFGIHYKSVPKSQVDEILDSLLFDMSKTASETDEMKEEKVGSDDNAAARILEAEEEKYGRYAQLKLGLVKGDNGEDYRTIKFADIEDLLHSKGTDAKLQSKSASFESYYDVLIDFDTCGQKMRAKLEEVIGSELKKIESLNRFVSGYLGEKAISGADLGLDGKLRWLMVIQALRYLRYNGHSGASDATDEAKERYLCAYNCLVLKKFGLKECLGGYLSYKDKKLNENSNAAEFDAKSFAIAKYVVSESKDVLSFVGKIMKYVPTRGGKVFDHMVGLMFSKDDGSDELYYEKLKILMTGKYMRKFDVMARGTSWIHCPLNTVIKLKAMVGKKKWDLIEKSMHGTYGWVYRASDIPNRHGHCNSNPNPKLVTVFKGFGV